ncbi:MAG: efflux RND transporter periplasmic adaptor subunit [Desulfobacterales bacterium]|nr:efflux RND transporter periplasmic adaptor subunit [Desulfobacterales bacterium]
MQFNESVRKSISLRLAIVALLVCLLSVGCDRRQQQSPPPAVREVSTVTVQPQKIMLSMELPGRMSAFRIAEIRPQVSGLILKKMFEEGSDVKAGQALYQIDPAPLQAALNNAMAALNRAEANLPALKLRTERYKDLLVDNAVSQQEYDDAAAALTQAEADVQYWKATVETARINMAYSKVVAPISGRIGKSNVTVGAIVTAYQPVALATIQQLDPIYANVPQSTTELLRLKNSGLNHNAKDQNKVKLILENNTTYHLEGTLQFSDVTVDPTTGSVILRVVFPNPENVLLPGMFVRTVIKEGIDEQAILIPQQGVSRDPKGNPVAMIVDAENKVGLRMLTLDRAIGDKWFVTAGLTPGDQVIVEGIQMLRPGTIVKTVLFQESGDKSATEIQPVGESN